MLSLYKITFIFSKKYCNYSKYEYKLIIEVCVLKDSLSLNLLKVFTGFVNIPANDTKQVFVFSV